jgi:hypothetical protein
MKVVGRAALVLLALLGVRTARLVGDEATAPPFDPAARSDCGTACLYMFIRILGRDRRSIGPSSPI